MVNGFNLGTSIFCFIIGTWIMVRGEDEIKLLGLMNLLLGVANMYFAFA